MAYTPLMLQSERIEGGLVGLLVGDALGVPYEFQRASALPSLAELEFTPPPGFRRSHAAVPPGTWSDDGAQALCLAASLLHHGRFVVDDFARRLANWYEWGYLAVDGHVFDVGVQTGAALRTILAGGASVQPAPTDNSGLGNGALMRVLPLALLHRGDDAALIGDARLSSRVTHPHLRSQLCCALYCLWARGVMRGEPEPWSWAVARLRAHLAAEPDAEAELEFHIRPDEPPLGRGSGYVVDSLRSARMVLEAGCYEAVVKAAVALGDDTDTTAAIAGGIAGLRDGRDAIPRRWRDALRGRELLDPILAGLRATA